jgi:hypothetical protein
MDNITKAFGAIILVVLLLFINVIGTSLAGYCAGWVVGLFFTEAFDHVLMGLGFKPWLFTLPQFGALVGFVGGFMKTKVSMDTATATKTLWNAIKGNK